MRKAIALQVDRLKTQELFPGVLFEWQLLFRANSLGAQLSGQKVLAYSYKSSNTDAYSYTRLESLLD